MKSLIWNKIFVNVSWVLIAAHLSKPSWPKSASDMNAFNVGFAVGYFVVMFIWVKLVFFEVVKIDRELGKQRIEAFMQLLQDIKTATRKEKQDA